MKRGRPALLMEVCIATDFLETMLKFKKKLHVLWFDITLGNVLHINQACSEE
jgi:hypothetical protein